MFQQLFCPFRVNYFARAYKQRNICWLYRLCNLPGKALYHANKTTHQKTAEGGAEFVTGYKRINYYAGIYIWPVWHSGIPYQPAADNFAVIVYVVGEYCNYILCK